MNVPEDNTSPTDLSAPEGPGRPTRAEAMALTILGMDWGRRRIGLAIKPAGQDWPVPQATRVVAHEGQALTVVREAVARSQAQAVVVGLPLHDDPTQAHEIKRFCRKARQGMSGVRWFFVDETLTTQAADSLSLARPSRRPTDDLAAKLILESFLQTCR